VPSAHAEESASDLTGYYQTHAQRLSHTFNLNGPTGLFDAGNWHYIGSQFTAQIVQSN
jgi:hypothetical protein